MTWTIWGVTDKKKMRHICWRKLFNKIDTTNCILFRDFHFKSINWDDLSSPRALDNISLNCISENLLTQVVTELTRLGNTQDLALVGDASAMNYCRVCDHFGNSDHNTIELSLQSSPATAKNIPVF